MTREKYLEYLQGIMDSLDDRKVRLVYCFALALTKGTERPRQE